jgi:predicted transcriptional regulator
MSLERIYKTDVVAVPPDASVLDVARLMRTRHTGSVVVVEDHCPVGLITDRDIVVKLVAADLDSRRISASDVMSAPLALVNINYDPLDVTRIMRARGLRRLPVVDEHRHLLGIVTLDDVLRLLGTEIANLAEAVQLEINKETVASPAS